MLEHHQSPQSMDMEKPHALCFPFPALGHINPMMHLSHTLASSGFKITFLLTQHFHSLMQGKAGAGAGGLDFSLVAVPDGLSPQDREGPEAANKLFGAVARMRGVVERLLEDLQKEKPPVSCIISDTFVSWTQVIADKFRIPRVAFWTSHASSYLIHHYTPLMVSKGCLPIKATTAGASPSNDFITCIPGLPSLPVDYLPSVLQVEDLSDFVFNALLRQFEGDRRCAWLIINTFEELDRESVVALQEDFPLLSVGPLLPAHVLGIGNSADSSTPVHLWEEDDFCLRWLDSKAAASVIYVSFGSIASLPKEHIQQLALGLESSQQPFLWVIRSNNPNVKTTDLLPEGYLERTKEQGLIISWAPQLKVLSHSSVGGFLTHCGWNSTIESISLGVPLIGWPTDFGEQKTTCWLMEKKWGVGLELKAGEGGAMEKGEVEKAVRRLMEGEEGRALRGKTASLSEAAKRATREGGSSRKNLEEFIQDMKQRMRMMPQLH